MININPDIIEILSNSEENNDINYLDEIDTEQNLFL